MKLPQDIVLGSFTRKTLKTCVEVIPLGLEPKTHALEGRCSNPAELRNQP